MIKKHSLINQMIRHYYNGALIPSIDYIVVNKKVINLRLFSWFSAITLLQCNILYMLCIPALLNSLMCVW